MRCFIFSNISSIDGFYMKVYSFLPRIHEGCHADMHLSSFSFLCAFDSPPRCCACHISFALTLYLPVPKP